MTRSSSPRTRSPFRTSGGRARLALVLAVVAGPGAGLLAAACGEQVHGVRLVFTNDGKGTRGFFCKEEDGDGFLLKRALTSGHASIVVDYVHLGGSPLCRPIKLFDWCRSNGCEIFEEERTCIDLPPVDGTDGGQPEALDTVSEALRELEGALVTADAPQEPVLVRVVAMASTCAEVKAGGIAFDCHALIGCANSCPIFLPSVEEVPLDLDAAGEHCEDAVVTCASSDLGSPETSCQ